LEETERVREGGEKQLYHPEDLFNSINQDFVWIVEQV